MAESHTSHVSSAVVTDTQAPAAVMNKHCRLCQQTHEDQTGKFIQITQFTGFSDSEKLAIFQAEHSPFTVTSTSRNECHVESKSNSK